MRSGYYHRALAEFGYEKWILSLSIGDDNPPTRSVKQIKAPVRYNWLRCNFGCRRNAAPCLPPPRARPHLHRDIGNCYANRMNNYNGIMQRRRMHN